ncbi:MAG: YlqD family protein [Desulfotomaculales bacterium]
MESVTITRPVIIKVRVTESFKRALIEQLEAQLRNTEREVERLDFEIRRARTGGARLEQVERRLQDERNRCIEFRRSLLAQLRAARELKEGDKVVRGRAESLIEVRAGDDWHRLLPVEILVEEGRIVAIREAAEGEMAWEKS